VAEGARTVLLSLDTIQPDKYARSVLFTTTAKSPIEMSSNVEAVATNGTGRSNSPSITALPRSADGDQDGPILPKMEATPDMSPVEFPHPEVEKAILVKK